LALHIDGISWKAGNTHQFRYEYRRTSVSQIFNRGFRGNALKFRQFWMTLSVVYLTGGSHRQQYNRKQNTLKIPMRVCPDSIHMTLNQSP